MSINLQKFEKLKGDCQQLMGARRALTEDYRELTDDIAAIRQSIHQEFIASRKRLGDWDVGSPLADLLTFSDIELKAAYINANTVRRALDLEKRRADLQARSAALDAQIAPLSQLLGNLTKYVEANHHG